MPRVYELQNSFARGELSPRLHGRTDIEHYRMGLKECTNWYVLRQGALRKRSGTKFISEVKDSSAKTRLVPFIFSTEQAYVLEFGNLYFRVFANGAAVTETGLTITGATQANPVVVSVVNSLSNGDSVRITGVVGMTELNNREFTVANQTGTTIELSGIDGTGFTAYSSAGEVAEIVEVVTPYLTADLFQLQFAQSADTLYVAHPGYAPMKITRTSDTAWTVTEIAFLDGPFLKRPTTSTSLTLSADGNVIPDMTSLTLPSGTVASSLGAANAWNAADRDKSTRFTQNDSGAGWWEYDAGSAKTVVGYYLTAPSVTSSTPGMPLDFVFQGFTGSIWVTLDARLAEDPWLEGETRFYEFENVTAYDKYRVKWTRIGAGLTTGITEVAFKESAATMAAITLTASAVNDINDGQGFLSTDVGRAVRFRFGDARWRWFVIEAYTSTTIVTGVLHGQPLFEIEPTINWRMGAWSEETGYPGSVTFFEERLVWARTNTEPQKVWGSKTFGFEDHGISVPLVDDDAFSIEIASDRVNEIKWLRESSDLIIGTSGAIRTLGPADTSKAFTATNLRQRRHTTVGAGGIEPIRVGNVIVYTDRFEETLRELLFSFDINAYDAPELTILSDHILKRGIAALAFAEIPDSVIWAALDTGELASLTFERDQKIVGMTNNKIAGGSADTFGEVESVVSIPGTVDSEVWVIVKRTINGGTVRYTEKFASEFEGNDVEDARFLDSYIEYSGSAAGTVTGGNHMEGETVTALADGLVYSGLTVTGGSVTLPNSATAENIAVGLGYMSTITQLRPALIGRDGSHFGRIKAVQQMFIDVFETLGIKMGPTGREQEVIQRKAGESMDQQIALRTGIFKAHLKGSHRDFAETTVLSEDPLPATVRGINRSLDFEP